MKERIEFRRNQELFRLGRIIIGFISIPVTLQAILTDVKLYGYNPVWVALRLGIIPVGMLAILMYKMPIVRRIPAIPLAVVVFYIAGFHNFFVTQTGYSESQYFHSYVQILMALTLLPFSWLEFGIFSGTMLSAYIFTILAHVGFDTSVFSHQNLIFIKTYVIISFAIFYVSNRVRSSYYKKEIQLEDELNNREIVITNQVKQISDARVSIAIARTTQSLAHDVRKPFSMFKSIIQVVEATEDPREVKEVLKLTLPEVNQAMASVEGMIQDVMQIGAEATLHLEDAAPESLVESALGELFRVYPEADVAIAYEFSHRHMVKADSVRLGRVFANILGNAVQAMREKGALWIQTSERDEFVEFTLGNGGSLIPQESLPKLFDAFFTSGKKGGTGLGLAIAKKIVEAHGGAIRCVSEKNEQHPEGMVEFRFTLPVSSSACSPRSEALPRSSREIQAALAAVRIAASRQGSAGPDPRETELEASILARLDAIGLARPGPVTVLVVEDEAVYRNGLLALLGTSEAIAARVRMILAKNDAEAMAAVREHSPVLVIEDIDLGPASKDGLEIVKSLRASGFAGHICVHSNRFLAQDSKAAMFAGADTVLPKPLGRAHFLRLVLASLPEEPSGAMEETAAPVPARKLKVALLDDSISMRLAWKMELEAETEFRHFASSMAFFKACAEDPVYLSSLDVVITDYNFAPGDPHDGGTLARELRERGYKGLILRASGESDLGPEIEALFDGDVGKAALEWPAFQAAVDVARVRRDQV